MRFPCPHGIHREDVKRILMIMNILGIDILQGQTLQTSMGEVCLWVIVIKPVLRGNANWEIPLANSGNCQTI